MNRREMAALQRNAWYLALVQLDKCREGAKEVERIVEHARAAARGAAAFMAALSSPKSDKTTTVPGAFTNPYKSP